jgi:hypothetical protein
VWGGPVVRRVALPAGEDRSLGHVERNDQSLPLACRRRALLDGQVAEVDVIVDGLEPVSGSMLRATTRVSGYGQYPGVSGY